MENPLKDLRILVTRGNEQRSAMSELIKKYGGIPIEVPLLRYALVDTVDTRRKLETIASFSWIFFTSVNGVKSFFDLLNKMNITFPQGVKVAAVGTKTANCLEAFGVTVDYIPSLFNAEVMGREFLPIYESNNNVLLVQGNLSRDVLPLFFEEQNIPYDTVVVYETKVNEREKTRLQQILEEEPLDVLTFTSPSCVHAFFELGGELAKQRKSQFTLCIGTTTEEAAKKAGFHKILTPKQFTVPHMVEALVDYVKKGNEII